MGNSGGPLVIGVDSSTQSTKAEVREVGSGTSLGIGRSPHPPTYPPCSQQDPALWWSALVDAVSQLGDLRRDVVAISVGAQQHGLVVCDADGTPLRPAKLWNDTESAPQAQRLVADLGADAWAAACGSVPVAAFTVTKLAWLAENEPEVLARVAAVALPHDWLTWRLCGSQVTDRGDASGTGWYDGSAPVGGDDVLRTDLLCAALVGAPGVLADPERWVAAMPRVLGPAEAAGPITRGAAEELGLSEEVIVAPGTGDNMAAALGLGMSEGDVTFSLGTSGTVYSVHPSQTHDSSGYVAGFADATGRYLPLVCTLNATRVTDTVSRWLDVDLDVLAEMAMAADPDRGGRPRLIPYFDGERTPNLPDASGSLVGLRNDTSREDLALAAHDGVLSGLIGGLDALRSAGVQADGQANLVGGGARSAAYRQRLADLLGRSVCVPTEQEAVAAGAAVQAAVVAVEGTEADFAAIARRWELGQGPTVEPRS